jgi:hypothetical protein
MAMFSPPLFKPRNPQCPCGCSNTNEMIGTSFRASWTISPKATLQGGVRLKAMTELELEVQDGDITIWLPGTSYTVTYYKPKNSPQLLAMRIASKDDPQVAMTGADFLAAAWRLANNKARELGWIV